MKRHITPQSLFNDIRKGRIDCEKSLIKPIAVMLRDLSSHTEDGKRVWRNLPVVAVIDEMIECIEKLLWDSGHITEKETNQRQRVFTRIVAIKKEVNHLISRKNG